MQPPSIEAVFRTEFPRVVATLAAFVGDIGLAEDLAQDALVDALRQWPRDGTPRNPGAWLTAVGKRRAVDLFRRNRTLHEKYAHLGRELQLAWRDQLRRTWPSIRNRQRRSPTTNSA